MHLAAFVTRFQSGLITVVCLAAAAAPSTAQKPVSANLTVDPPTRQQIAALTARSDSPARGAAIIERLHALGIPYRLQPFVDGGRIGTNILVTLPGSGARRLMLGAHYDQVREGNGVVDNASGVAAVLSLLAAFKDRPLKNLTVSAAFFDLEEIGLLGSKAYVAAATRSRSLPSLFINFDVFGYGDTLWLMSKNPASAATVRLREAARQRQISLVAGALYPPSDHLSFSSGDVEALSISLLDGSEIAGMQALLRGERSTPPPRLLSIIHTSADTRDKYDADAVGRALPVVEHAIRELDQRWSSSAAKQPPRPPVRQQPARRGTPRR